MHELDNPVDGNVPFNFVLREKLAEKHERKTTLNEKCKIPTTPQLLFWVYQQRLIK